MKQCFVLSLLILASACEHRVEHASDGAGADLTAASVAYEKAYAAAVAAIEDSAARGHEWSSSGKLLQQGAAAAANGDEALAIQLTDKARIQAELSIRQADIEESAWKDRVLSN